MNNKKEEIVNFHLENNAFYKELVGNKFFSKWEDLPVLNKRNLTKTFTERLSKGFSLKNVYLNKTSGSSGDPFIFAKDKFCHALTWARILYVDLDGLELILIIPFKHDFMEFLWILLANKKERFKDFLSQRFRFQYFDLSDKG